MLGLFYILEEKYFLEKEKGLTIEAGKRRAPLLLWRRHPCPLHRRSKKTCG